MEFGFLYSVGDMLPFQTVEKVCCVSDFVRTDDARKILDGKKIFQSTP